MRKMGATSIADLIKVAEIIDVQGNSSRHRPSSRRFLNVLPFCRCITITPNEPCTSSIAPESPGFTEQ